MGSTAPERFVHDSHAQRVWFASGGAAEAVRDEVAARGFSRVMLIVTPSAAGVADVLAAPLPVVHRHDEVTRHVPVAVAERARRAAGDCTADVVVSIGGGSATGLAKAVALTTGLPVVAVPTTYSGSEATTVWGLTEDGRKTTGVDVRVLPVCVVYDATLTLGLPVALSAVSGLNALAHCVDAMWGPRADPIDRALAGEGARGLHDALLRIAADPADLAGREQALYGTYLSGVAFSSAGSGLHHKICHVLGGRFDLPHAETHAVVLPYVLAFNAPAAPDAEARLSAAFGARTALDGLLHLRDAVRAPRSLRDLGMAPGAVDGVVDEVLRQVPAGTPRPVTATALRRLLHAAEQGSDPHLLDVDR